jgi:UPF0148 protein
MTADKADEIMAEYLLKGGKMLAKSCKTCGYPMFEYKGETQCVICPVAFQKDADQEETARAHVPESTATLCQSVANSSLPYGPAVDELERTLVHLCERIRQEPRTDECLMLMKAIKKGAQALAALRQR